MDNLDYAVVYNELKTLLAPIGEKLGAGATFAWDVVVRQMETIGVGMLIGAGFSLFTALSITWLAMKCGGKASTFKDVQSYYMSSARGEWKTAQVILHILAMFPFALSSWLVINGVMHLMNPDFYALEFFVNMVKTNAPTL